MLSQTLTIFLAEYKKVNEQAQLGNAKEGRPKGSTVEGGQQPNLLRTAASHYIL